MTIWTPAPKRPNDGNRYLTADGRTSTLDALMGLDCLPIVVLADGRVIDTAPDPRAVDAPYPPDLTLSTDDDGQATPDSDADLMRQAAPWSLLTGHTGQYGYRGPVMHASEFIGGGLADAILSTPGAYVAVIVSTDAPDDDAGWAIAHIPAPAPTRAPWHRTGAGAWRPTGADGVVTTWADGLGRWHASVPLALTGVPASTDPADVRRMLARASRIARTAIRSELDARGISSAYRMRVKRIHLTAHGTAHYSEV